MTHLPKNELDFSFSFHFETDVKKKFYLRRQNEKIQNISFFFALTYNIFFVCVFRMELKSCKKWFDAINDGSKTIEGRLCLPSLKIGDEIVFKCWKRQVIKRVSFIHHYSCFAELLEQEDRQLILPNVGTHAEGVKIFESWYPSDVQRRKGVVAIGLANLKKRKINL